METTALTYAFSLLALLLIPTGIWVWRQHLPERGWYLFVGAGLLLGFSSGDWSLWLREDVIHPLTGLGKASACIQIGWIAPIAEETVKGLSALALILAARSVSRESNLEAETAAMLGAFVGLGFGVVEGLYYSVEAASSSIEAGIFTAQVRVVGGYLHIGASALVGLGIGAAFEGRNWLAMGGCVSGYGLHLASNQLNECYGSSSLALLSFAVIATAIGWEAYRQFTGEQG